MQLEGAEWGLVLVEAVLVRPAVVQVVAVMEVWWWQQVGAGQRQ
jgi:hypothetical protein